MSENFHARRHRITIERKTVRRNTVGELLYHWEHACETWAEIRDNTITIRYQPELYPGDRVLIGKTYFQIIGVIDLPGKTRLVELRVKESGAGDYAPRALAMNSRA